METIKHYTDLNALLGHVCINKGLGKDVEVKIKMGEIHDCSERGAEPEKTADLDYICLVDGKTIGTYKETERFGEVNKEEAINEAQTRLKAKMEELPKEARKRLIEAEVKTIEENSEYVMKVKKAGSKFLEES